MLTLHWTWNMRPVLTFLLFLHPVQIEGVTSPLGRIPPLSDPGTRDATQRGGRRPQRGMYVCSSTMCNHMTISSAPSDWLFLVPIRSVHWGDSNWCGQTRRVGTACSIDYQPSLPAGPTSLL